MINTFSKQISEVINLRHSVRNYDNKELSNEVIEKIEKYISNIESPFSEKVRVKLIKKDETNKDIKLGTYGIIKGANYYLAVACENSDFSLEALGYAFEKVVLYCTDLGLGTVWMGGTFKKGEFAKTMNLKENESLPIVSPLGYEGGKKSILASMMGSKNKQRKDFSEVFFNNDFNNPLSRETAKEYAKVLEMVRVAPSAMNKQTWRILKQGNDFHLYIDSKAEMNRIDMGIAMCHFHLTAKESGLNGEFKDVNPKIDSKFKYVRSWIGKK